MQNECALVPFSMAMSQSQRDLVREGTFSSSLSSQGSLGGRSFRHLLHHTLHQEEREKEGRAGHEKCLHSACFTLFYSVQDPSPQNSANHGAVFPPQPASSRNSSPPHRQTQRLVSRVIPDPGSWQYQP